MNSSHVVYLHKFIYKITPQGQYLHFLEASLSKVELEYLKEKERQKV
ncbi:MAG: hypothetical protein ACI9TV_001864 [Sulfurimonas sp.]|jgi:hypothetical protein